MPARRPFSLLELLIVTAILALVAAVALPRVGRVPARLEAEQGVSAVRRALDEAGLRARATGQAVRLALEADEEGGSRFVVSALDEDPLALPLAQSATAVAAETLTAMARNAAAAGDAAILPGTLEYPLPKSLIWEPESLDEGTLDGDTGPLFVFFSNGEAGGPALRFTIRGQRFELELDRLTGRLDVQAVAGRP